jgi:hypothetical protein
VEEIRKKIHSSFDTCDRCGYNGGFHCVPEPVKFSEHINMKLKCPNCSQIFNIGWIIKPES